MKSYQRHFNCCKAFACSELGITSEKPEKTFHLGFESTYCPNCSSFPPWVDDETVTALIDEFSQNNFSTAPFGCPDCKPVFFEPPLTASRYGKTSAGRQRLKCNNCDKIFTPGSLNADPRWNQIIQGIMARRSALAIAYDIDVSPKVYYQLLHRLANGLRMMARKLESQNAQKPFMAILTESKVLPFKHGHSLWALSSCDADSGYVLLNSTNLSQVSIPEDGHYSATEFNRSKPYHQLGLYQALIKRYENTMARLNFENLNYGIAKPIAKAQLVKPALVAYAHFQLLRNFTQHSDHFHHYLEHESCIRGAGLMSCIDEIKAGNADVFYVFRHHHTGTELSKDGEQIGWWNDRWYPFRAGAWSPITPRKQYQKEFELTLPLAVKNAFKHMLGILPPELKSAAPLQSIIEIQRCVYNFCNHDAAGYTPAMRQGFTDLVWNTDMLVHSMISEVANFHIFDANL